MNNQIKIIKKSNSNYDKKILIIGVFHGDEWQGEYFINSYLKNSKKPKKNEVYYIPRLNNNTERKNKRGVDLNRNFPTKNWIKSVNNDYFGGEKPNSEIETKFLVDLIDKNDFSAIITLHAPYKVINYDGPALELAQKIQKFINYKITSDIGYPTPGSFGTYCGIERNIPTITLEIDEDENIENLKNMFHKLFEYLENEYW